MSEPIGLGTLGTGSTEHFMDLARTAREAIRVVPRPGGRLVGADAGKDEAAQLRKAAIDFEAVFLYQILKQMRATVEKEKMFHGGLGEDIFSEMMDEEFSKKMAGQSTGGIAEMLLRQLGRQHGIRVSEEAEGTAGSRFSGKPGVAGSLQQRLRSLRTRTTALDPATTCRIYGL